VQVEDGLGDHAEPADPHLLQHPAIVRPGCDGKGDAAVYDGRRPDRAARQDRLIFPTIQFAVFFVAVFTVSWLLMQRQALWKPFILAASYVFYGYTDARFVLLLFGSTIFNQVMAEALHRTRDGRARNVLTAVAVGGNLAALGWFKYYNFFLDSVTTLFSKVGATPPLPLLQVALPVGISFFTFQALSYVIDVQRRAISPAKPVDFAVYLAFFPHLVAGPIVRASEFIPQLRRPQDPRRIQATRAFFLIVGGLVKKVVIADFLATHIVDDVFDNPAAHSTWQVLVGIYGYAVQIFCDFSGYSEMAIGIALLLGFRFPENFNAPYTAVSLQDFWRRWHMSLSRWLRDYLYIPLGGNRGSGLFTYRNLMLTMLLGGLWHGAAWNFVIWGGIHGVGLAVERVLASRREARGHAPARDTVARRVVGRLVTFHVVCLAWVFFRADGVGSAFSVFGRLLSFDGGGAVAANVLALVAVGIGMQYLPRDATGRLQRGFARLSVGVQGAVLAACLVLVSALGNQEVAAFIYFQF
jgi:D-alanyl-lipoteichoic acid acyltransferase DltB (MBOAT superfamily)